MRALVIGCGSIGQRHIRNLAALGIRHIAAFDPQPGRAELARDLGASPFPSLDAAVEMRPDIVLVCTPPHQHTTAALLALSVGAHVLVEKPIAVCLTDADELLRAAARAQRVLGVGYNLRFHAGLREVKRLLEVGSIGPLLGARAEFGQYLPDWRPKQDYRLGYNVHAAMGGGIILDASHEIDYVRWLAGEVASVYCVASHLSALETDAEDTAAIIMRMTTGAVSELHLDCVQRGYSRGCKLIGEVGTLIWDFQEGIRLLSAGTSTWQGFPMTVDPNAMYVDELRHFIQCVRGESEPVVDGATGKRVLEVALAAKASSQSGYEMPV